MRKRREKENWKKKGNKNKTNLYKKHIFPDSSAFQFKFSKINIRNFFFKKIIICLRLRKKYIRSMRDEHLGFWHA